MHVRREIKRKTRRRE